MRDLHETWAEGLRANVTVRPAEQTKCMMWGNEMTRGNTEILLQNEFVFGKQIYKYTAFQPNQLFRPA